MSLFHRKNKRERREMPTQDDIQGKREAESATRGNRMSGQERQEQDRASFGPKGYGQHGENEGTWYWVWAIENGKPALFGPCATEQAANQEGFQKTAGNYEVLMLPTRNLANAVRMIRARRTNEEGLSLFESTARMRHK